MWLALMPISVQGKVTLLRELGVYFKGFALKRDDQSKMLKIRGMHNPPTKKRDAR